jgi:hypothetical protein
VRQTDHGGICFGDDDYPGGVFVNAMYQARANPGIDVFVIIFANRQVREMVYQCIDKGSFVIAMGGVYDHAGGFIYDNDVIVFKDDVEGNVLGD